MGMLWAVNPKKRRGRRKLSAAQKAAGFGGKRGKRRTRRAGARRRRHSAVVAALPVMHRRRRRSAARAAKRGSRRGRRSSGFRMNAGGMIGLLKAGAIGGAGAVAVDLAMGQVRGFLPATMQSPADANGQPNLAYYGVKAAVALALGTYGKRLPVIGKYAERGAEGALTVLAYQFMRPMVPASMTVGYFNPAPVQRPALNGTGAYVRGVSAYAQVPVRAGAASGKGARASQVLSMVNVSRRAA